MIKNSFNENWVFKRMDEETWQPVRLPHDAMLCEPRMEEACGGTNTGWFAGRDYLYEKEFFVPEEWKGKEVVLEFEGIYRDAKVFINGKEAASHDYGYIGFSVTTNQFLQYGVKNRVRVLARNAEQPSSRWYTGAGIYRSVWLCLYPKKHIMPMGLKITTLDYQKPKIQIELKTNAQGTAWIEILDGNEVFVKTGLDVISRDNKEKLSHAAVEIELQGAKLWSVEHPKLYTCRVCFDEDLRKEVFGIRMVECDSRRGFRLNGERIILKGACVHHDNGILGAVAHPFAEERKIRLLREAGFNAVRCAHNPCSNAFLEACDRLGMLVVDEYVDMWYIHKTKYDYATKFEERWREDLQAMVERDYNHPSVIMYSIGNEVSETAQKKGISLCGEMTAFLHERDNRLVTCGINIFFNYLSSMGFGVYSDKKAERGNKKVGSDFFNTLAGIFGSRFMKFGATLRGSDRKTREAFAKLDVAGYNYGIDRYNKDFKKYPRRVILGSETFGYDAARFWNTAKENPALIGDFVWSGIDYLGEVGIGAMEYHEYAPDFGHGPGWICAGTGMLDLTGQMTAQAAYVQVAYEKSMVRIGVVPANCATERHSPSAWRMSNAFESWSWNGCEGKKTRVEVYARGDKAALFLNGEKLGCKPLGKDCRISFWVRWHPGLLEAVVYGRDGNEIARTALASGGEKTHLSLLPEKEEVDFDELCYVRIRYVDEEGVLKPLARGDVKVEVQGGDLMALGNACPYNERGYLQKVTDTYYGEALAIIRPSNKNEIYVKAKSPYGEADTRVACGRKVSAIN